MGARLWAARLMAIASLLAWVAAARPGAVGGSDPRDEFITRDGHRLWLADQPWTFLGANAYWLMDNAKEAGQRHVVDIFFGKCQDVGLSVIRLWGFNHHAPSARGVYAEAEMAGFDYIIFSARQHGLRLVLALGNTWPAYRSPEDFMRLAGLDPETNDLLTFYTSDPVKAIFKEHITSVVNRFNRLTGLPYNKDPTIMMWDVFNEPRCPGCVTAQDQGAHLAWLNDMAGHLKAQAPQQLVAAGTEGYFMDAEHVGWNPGAGAACEGENWMAISALPSLDVTISHIYDRQMESVPPSWRRPTYDDLLAWWEPYLAQHQAASLGLGKPHILEEFNVLASRFSETQRAAVFTLVADALVASRAAGGALVGAMFWNAALVGCNDDGYNIYLDEGAPALAALAPPEPEPAAPASSSPSPQTATSGPIEALDRFRRGPQRAVCAEAQAGSWLPLWAGQGNSTGVQARLAARVGSRTALDVIRATAQQLRGDVWLPAARRR